MRAVEAEPEPFSDGDHRDEQIIRRFSSAILNGWRYPLLKAAWGKLLLFLIPAGLCAVRAYVGLIGSRGFSHDAFMLLDGAWRVLNGQRPHIDFYSHVGFLTYLPTAIGLRISHGTAWGLGYGQALVGLLLGIWTYLLGRKRLADVSLALMCISVVLMVVAPFALGFSPMKPGPAMIYNRQGYALLALVLLEAFSETRRRSRQEEFWGGFSTGAALSILFFLKITYFAAGVFLLVALLPCRQQTKQRWTGIVGGCVAVTFACCAYFGFHLGPMEHDLVTIGGGKHMRWSWYLIDAVIESAGVAAALASGVTLLLAAQSEGRAARSVAILGLAVTVGGVALIFGNYEQSGFPMTVFLAIIALNVAMVKVVPTSRSAELFEAAVLLLGSVLIAGSLFSGAMGTAFAFGQRVFFHRTTAFDSPALSGFTTGPDDDWYTALVNDGIPLVEKYRRPGDTLMSLDFSNPFSYSLGMKPAYGGTSVFQYGTTFNDRFKPSPAFLMGSADLVAVPKTASDPTLDNNVPRLYGPYLLSHFHLIGESRDWRLYRRNGE
ncbi:MAG: hypothetical protein M3Y24_11870 [Acidobacteriota bacterium]|nr:hypothetical protein [Acidobacteriota bacterium]